jgi:hypothetical protein
MALVRRVQITQFKEIFNELPVDETALPGTGFKEYFYTNPFGQRVSVGGHSWFDFNANTVASSGSPIMRNLYEFDLNNDGIPDLLTLDVDGDGIEDPFGFQDFIGVVHQSFLLVKIRIFDYGDQNLTIPQIYELAARGGIEPFSTRDLPGWIILGESKPTFYYERCSTTYNDVEYSGRIPVSRYYFDMDDMPIFKNQDDSWILVDGNGPNALNQVGLMNIMDPMNPLISQNGFEVNFGPSLEEYPTNNGLFPFINAYLRMVVNPFGVSMFMDRKGQPLNLATITSDVTPINLHLATREDILSYKNNTTLNTSAFSNRPFNNNPNYQNVPDSIPFSDGAAQRWGTPWLAISSGFALSNEKYTGRCIVVLDDELPPDTAVDEDEFTEIPAGDTSFENGLPSLNPCGEGPFPINLPPYEVVTPDERDQVYLSHVTNLSSDTVSRFPIVRVSESDTTDRAMDTMRKIYQTMDIISGYRDPREISGDNYDLPNGILHAVYNNKTCTYDIIPALRDKDGDIPEPIGPVVSSYFSQIRKNMMERFGVLTSPLLNIGTGSNGYSYYSDGNGYVELIGESAFGCGDPLSFGLDIPEVVVEIDKLTTTSETVIWAGNEASSKAVGKQYITDYLMDMAYGIPDNPSADYPFNQISLDGKNKDRWQSVMYPIYDSIWNGNQIDYKEIDNAISILVKGDLKEAIQNNNRPGLTWDWLLSRGFGNFSINVKYTFGTGNGEPGDLKIWVDVVGFILFFAGIAALAIDWLSKVFDPEPPKSASPEERRVTQHKARRLHKKGNLVLLSRSKTYYTTHKPCEQILLGFSDPSYYGKKSRRSIIENLSKVDSIDKVFVSKEGSSYTYFDVKPMSTVFEIPDIGRRMKKYGRNPLLDVFYLNVVGNARPDNRYSQERRFSHTNRLPFRKSPNTSDNQWGTLKYGQFPSMFPQHWNNVNTSSPRNELTLTVHNASSKAPVSQRESTYGDSFWQNRVANTILPLKDRWDLTIDYDNNNVSEPIAVLIDKTPILDLYFALMEMHIKGVSWKEILTYVDSIVGCVTGTEYNENLDMVRLENIWNVVKNRLNEVHQFENGNSKTLYVGSYDFGELIMLGEDDTISPTDDVIYAGSVKIHNSSDDTFRILSIQIESDDSTDIYGKTSAEYFYLNDPITNLWDEGKPPSTIPSKNKNGGITSFDLPVWFVPKMAQPNFQYNARVVVTATNLTTTQTSAFYGNISGVCISDIVTDSYEEYFEDPLVVADYIDFNPDETSVNFTYSNSNPYQDVTIKEFVIISQKKYTDSGNLTDLNSNELVFGFFGVNRFDSTSNSISLPSNLLLPKLNDPMNPNISSQTLTFTSTDVNASFQATLVIKYEISNKLFEKRILINA